MEKQFKYNSEIHIKVAVDSVALLTGSKHLNEQRKNSNIWINGKRKSEQNLRKILNKNKIRN